jgi:putative membrane protein insertion efficiency factor
MGRPMSLAVSGTPSKESYSDEAHLPAEPDSPEAYARLSRADEDTGRSGDTEAAPVQGSEAAGCRDPVEVAMTVQTARFRRTDRLLRTREFQRWKPARHHREPQGRWRGVAQPCEAMCSRVVPACSGPIGRGAGHPCDRAPRRSGRVMSRDASCARASRRSGGSGAMSEERHTGALGRALIMGVRAYRWTVSPWLGPACRFEPTCSHYALEAIERHGAASGGWLAIRRLCRCHPIGGSGYDPVP